MPPTRTPVGNRQTGFFIGIRPDQVSQVMSDTANTTENLNIAAQRVLASPATLKESLPASDSVRASIREHRQAVIDVLEGRDHRLLVVVGPCSIHNVDEALSYALRLRALASEVDDNLLIIMRTYFEKPRTTVGWKGLINDPFLDDSFRIESGLQMARKLLLDLAALGLPLATEALDPITPQYLHDLISWTAIGARTTESQTHRELASGLSAPVGFKNGTDGGLDVVLNALQSVAHPHRFLGINESGEVAITTTRGNPGAHVVLRGGSNGPNYDSAAIERCENALAAKGLPANIMVDCSHANSEKDHQRQIGVGENVARQIQAGNRSIMGLMYESNLHAGRQDQEPGVALAPGVSITDACISFEDTETALRALNMQLGAALKKRGRTAVRAA